MPKNELQAEPLNKAAVLKQALDKITKTYGSGAIWSALETDIPKTESISTGALTLDKALGIGGLPKGRITELYGPEQTGKTTLALHVIANVQAAGGSAAIIDVEHAIDLSYAKAIGVDVTKLLISQPDTGEQALEIAETLVRGNVDCVVIDSVAMLVPEAEIRGEMSDMQMGAQPRLIGKGLRKLMAPIANAGTIFILINQLRMTMSSYGNPETTPGGRAIKYMSSIRIDLRKKEPIKDGENTIGIRVKATVVKNKVAPPSKVAEFDLYYGKGIDSMGSLLDAAVTAGIITQAGAWYRYGNVVLGVGRIKAIDAMTSDLKRLTEIQSKL